MSKSAMRVDVGAVDDFREPDVSIVSAQGREVGVLRRNGEFFALRNICPHSGGPLCAGYFNPFLTEDPARPWNLVVDESRLLVTCPWHRWAFDVSTGRALVGNLRVKTYPVIVENGRVLLEIER